MTDAEKQPSGKPRFSDPSVADAVSSPVNSLRRAPRPDADDDADEPPRDGHDFLDHTVVGRDRTVLYGTPGIVNTFQVIAVDETGNRSSPATWTADMR